MGWKELQGQLPVGLKMDPRAAGPAGLSANSQLHSNLQDRLVRLWRRGRISFEHDNTPEGPGRPVCGLLGMWIRCLIMAAVKTKDFCTC